MKAIHDCVDNEEFKKDIEGTYLRNNGYGVKPEHRVKLHLNRRDDAIYNKLLEFDRPVSEKDMGETFIASSIYINYKYFCDARCVETWKMPEKYQVLEEGSGPNKTKMRPPFRFSMIGLSEGDEVVFCNNPAIVATVANDKQVLYGGKTWSLSGLAGYILGKDSSVGVQGPLYFAHNGVPLANLRDEIEANVL